MEDVNNLLNAGEVPNLFPLDEKQEICEKMRVFDRYDVSLVTQIEQKPAVTGIPIPSIPCREPALSWLDSLVGRTLLWYRRSHCFESHSSLIFLGFNYTAVFITVIIIPVFYSYLSPPFKEMIFHICTFIWLCCQRLSVSLPRVGKLNKNQCWKMRKRNKSTVH